MLEKLITDATKEISGTISNGFNALEKQLDRDLKIKEHNNKQLMDFQETVNSYNRNLHKYLMKMHQLKTLSKKSDDKNSKKKKITKSNIINIKSNLYEIISNIQHVKTNLITYISLWSINYTHGIISKNTVKNSLGILISEEFVSLKSDLHDIKKDKGGHYADALNFITLFENCGNEKVYNQLKPKKNDRINGRKGSK